eukprot:TRINITY_DN1800_c0_g2_i3.p1 TRINITY_DN1800_c0_g2~~TRINITY_DN1800_c0_g2_i3.p1  ORF type:complete len:236 (+),score=30.01 TRINITY_DN1800_c0_g2_i3:221-928(+)
MTLTYKLEPDQKMSYGTIKTGHPPSPVNPYVLTNTINEESPPSIEYTPRKRFKGTAYSDEELGCLLVSLFYKEDPNKAFNRWETQFGMSQRSKSSVKQKYIALRTEILENLLQKSEKTEKNTDGKLIQESTNESYIFLKPAQLKIGQKFYYAMYKAQWYSIDCKFRGSIIRFILTRHPFDTKIKEAIVDTTRVATLHYQIAPSEKIVGHYDNDEWCGVEVKKRQLPHEGDDDGWG